VKRISSALLALIALSLVPVPAPADPPPWAPAHGWGKTNDPDYVGYTGKKWQKDYGIIDGHCNTQAVGAVLGGVVGGGTLIGAVIGAKVGRALDDADRGCMGHALELAGEHSKVVWTNPNSGVHYELTPTRNVGDRKSACREFTTLVSSGKVSEAVQGVACRRANGEWVFRS